MSDSSSRAIVMIGLFSSLYIVSSGIVSFISQVGYPEHFLRGLLMTALVIRTKRRWSATMMGAVSGIVFAIVVPSPAPYLLASTFASGIVFDLVLMAGSYASSIRTTPKLLAAVATSGVAESLVALAILTNAGFFGRAFTLLAYAWSTDVVLNIVLSIVGAVLAIRFMPKIV